MITPLVLSSSGVSLTLHGLQGPTARVILSGVGMSSEREVSAAFTGVGGRFFTELLAFPEGWTDSKTWRSLEGELFYAATCDRTGHVTLAVTLGNDWDALGWSSTIYLHLELGQLAGVAQSFERFDEQLISAA